MTRNYGFLKPYPDAHTLGINTIKGILSDCGEAVWIAEESLFDFSKTTDHRSGDLKHWLLDHNITHLALSYRLDPADALTAIRHLITYLQHHGLLKFTKHRIQRLYYAGLPESCERIKSEFGTLITVFSGSETLHETLNALEIPDHRFPKAWIKGNLYDIRREALAKDYVLSKAYETLIPPIKNNYPEFGTIEDSLRLRLNSRRQDSDLPLTRVHVGPYLHERTEAVRLFQDWVAKLANSGYLDICSIGSSQLTQSHFDRDWSGLPNGGGVPIQTPKEYEMIYESSRPMLLRTYSGTSQVDRLVDVHEEKINIAWHALSLWWFNRLDGRGPNDLLTNLIQHTKALKKISVYATPFEPNIPHHFAFRGADDLTYIVSAVLGIRTAHHYGIREFIVQVMLNTPRATWGIVDLAKARSILQLLEPLKKQGALIHLQPRAGLDYFAPDLEKAKIQLASVSMLMDDIEPQDPSSPQIIHVVSYSEAVKLADPDIITESVKITLGALKHYRMIKSTQKFLEDYEAEIKARTALFVHEAKKILDAIESHLEDPYSPVGLATIFESGFLPTPYLWGNPDLHPQATHFKSRTKDGSTILTDDQGSPVSTEALIDFAVKQLPQVLETQKKAYDQVMMNPIDQP